MLLKASCHTNRQRFTVSMDSGLVVMGSYRISIMLVYEFIFENQEARQHSGSLFNSSHNSQRKINVRSKENSHIPGFPYENEQILGSKETAPSPGSGTLPNPLSHLKRTCFKIKKENHFQILV